MVCTLCVCGVLLMAADAPYPPSDAIASLTFDWSTHVRLAPGSDNWPITWADDDEQYTSWGDGGGFDGTNEHGRVSNGFARIEGNAESYRGVNTAGGVSAPSPTPFTGKCYGIVSAKGMLYSWRTGDASGETAYRFQELWKSSDRGVTWVATKVRFAREDFTSGDAGFFAPTFLQCGRDYADARDEYMYCHATNVKTRSWDIHRPGEIILMRVPVTELEAPAAYSFYAGHNVEGKPLWTSNVLERTPVWQDTTNGAMMASACLIPGLGRIVLTVEHSDKAQGNIGVYESETPWGPWRTVCFEEQWGADHIESSTFFWNFAPKWFNDDGSEFTLVFTGRGSNDSWNSVKGRFIRPKT